MFKAEIFLNKLREAVKPVFIGSSVVCRYLEYVVGEQLFKQCYENEADFLADNPSLCEYVILYENSRVIGENVYKNSMELAEFVKILDVIWIRNTGYRGKKTAYFGNGKKLQDVFEDIREIMPPDVVIDNKNNQSIAKDLLVTEYDDTKFNSAEWFIVITSDRYANEISDFLDEKGWRYGENFIDYRYILANMKNADMFIKTVYDMPLKKTVCRRPFEYINVGCGGYLTHCCYAWLPVYIGNILDIGTKITDTVTSRIIKVSFDNHTYSFCNTELCPLMKRKREQLYDRENVNYFELIGADTAVQYADMAFDNTCNLYCASCRNEMILDNDSGFNRRIADKVISSLLPGIDRITVAGNGEAFMSKAYQRILNPGSYFNVNLIILSNGNLFQEGLLKSISKNFKTVSIYISVDAASRETYRKVRRGGDWERLISNLAVISEYRKTGMLKSFILRFVVSTVNYMDMPEFVKLGEKLGVDYVDFSRIENWGTYTDEEFKKINIFDEAGSLKEKVKEILNKIDLENPIVKISNF